MFITSAIVFAFKIRHKAIKHRFVLELEMQNYNILKLQAAKVIQHFVAYENLKLDILQKCVLSRIEKKAGDRFSRIVSLQNSFNCCRAVQN